MYFEIHYKLNYVLLLIPQYLREFSVLFGILFGKTSFFPHISNQLRINPFCANVPF